MSAGIQSDNTAVAVPPLSHGGCRPNLLRCASRRRWARRWRYCLCDPDGTVTDARADWSWRLAVGGTLRHTLAERDALVVGMQCARMLRCLEKRKEKKRKNKRYAWLWRGMQSCPCRTLIVSQRLDLRFSYLPFTRVHKQRTKLVSEGLVFCCCFFLVYRLSFPSISFKNGHGVCTGS